MDENSSVGLGHYAVVLRRQWKTIALVTALGIGAAAGYLGLTPGSVTASTVVNLNVITTDPFNPAKASSALLDASTEQQLASSYVVAQAAASGLANGDSVEALRDGVNVTTSANGTTMTISYTSSTPQDARAGADALANSYLAYRQGQAEERKSKLQDQLQQQLTGLQKALPRAGSSASSMLAQIGSVQSQLNQLSLIDTSGGTVLDPAAQNEVSVQPQPATVMLTGSLAAFVLGLVLAFAVNMLDRRVRDWYDVRGAGAGPLLVRFAASRASMPATGADLDQFRVVRERLLASSNNRLRTLTVIDETRNSRPSDVAANLAVVLAEAGTRVELVLMGASDAQLGVLTTGLQLNSHGAGTDGRILRSALVQSLTVFRPQCGRTILDADEFVTEAVRRELIGRESGQVIILALPPSAPHASRLAAGRLSDLVLLVGECQRTRIDALALNAAEMNDVEAQLAGTVLVPAGRRIVDPENPAKEARHREVVSLPTTVKKGAESEAVLAESAPAASYSESASRAGSRKSS
ncbi:hypothetical protein [Arthrobacter sp. Soil763]|uniref:hypothetical protein n=1 Tax=Arthrobacter sp. Soil763 TaxID=1736402 RepID=UPI0007014CB7|nr:hypothetical protein [Arthrobacter sp. Soil763]KRE78530.1 hypothetical protein ASG71_11735 [Arthrobacter sp. Soil763]